MSRFIGVLSAALVVLIAFAAVAAPAQAAVVTCPPYEVIGVAGSGELDHDPASSEYMGAEVHDFYESLRGLLGSGVVVGYGVHYPAVSIFPTLDGVGAALHIGALGKYTASVREGQAETEKRLRSQHARCPVTRFVLAGYSQGAQVVGDVIQKSKLGDLVSAAALFGDPYRNADSWSSRGGDPSAYGAFGPRPEWDPGFHGRIFSYCHIHDIICNVSSRVSTPVGTVYLRNPAKASLSSHVSPAYRLVANGGRGDAGYAAREVARVLGFVPSPLPFSGPLDIAFVIDSTGSMSDEIDAVRDNVTALVGQIAAIDPDYRLALIDYKDEPGEESAYQSRLDLDFTTDVAAFDRSISGLEAKGGGDTAESVYSGEMTALGLAWRPGAKKVLVQIGDAEAKDPEPITGFTARAVQLKALSLDPATIDTIQTGEDPETATSFGTIAQDTGGQYLQLSEEQLPSLVPSISAEIRRNTIAPAAVLTAPSSAVVGQPTTLSAGESHDVGEAIAGYDWDVNGDGVFDASTVDPVLAYTYTAPFAGTVTVRVRSASGLSSLATAPLVVGVPPAGVPGKPRHLRGQLQGSRLTLSWRAGKGSAPAWFTILDRHGHALERLPVETIAAAHGFEATLSGLRPRGSYAFRVAAGAAGGESKPAGPVVLAPRKRRHHTGSRKHHRRSHKDHGGGHEDHR